MPRELTPFVIPSNKKLDDICTTATSFEEMMHALHEATGIPDASSDPFNSRPSSVTAAESALPAASGFEFEREIKFHESTGKRNLVIRAHTEADLDALERQILYGRS